jgi:hypothetical protein
MTGELGLCLAIVQEMLCRNGAFESGENILRCDTVPFPEFVEEKFPKKVNIPASSKTIGKNLFECSKRAKSMQTSGTVSYAPPAKKN